MGTSSAETRSPRFRLLLTCLLIVVLYLVCSVVSFSVTTEDAYISFRYAEHIAAGFGPVFNEGGERVEGYSNPTWVALLAIFNMIGLSPVMVGRCLGLLFGVLTLLEVILLLRSLRPGYGVGSAVAIGTAPIFLFWCQTGLETGLFFYLFVLSLRLVLREVEDPSRPPISALPLFLMAVTRPEGIIYSVILGVWIAAKIRSENRRKSITRLIMWALLILVPFCLFLLWRHSVFDAWVPNTFFAKVNNGLRWNLRVGSRYLIGFLNHSLWLPLLVPLVVALLPGRTRSAGTRRALQVIGLIALGHIAFVLYVGGDIHPYDRFGVLLLILSVLAVFLLVPEVGETPWWKRTTTWVIAVLLVGNLAYSFPPAPGIEPPIRRPPNMLAANPAGLLAGWLTPGDIWQRFRTPPPDALTLIGLDLAEISEEGDVLAADQCGKIPYWSRLNTVDLLGLNDPAIAHIVHSVSEWDLYAAEVLEWKPNTFVVVYRYGHLISRYYIENTILSEPFRSRYRLDAIYHTEYSFTDLVGEEHRFHLELLRFRALSRDVLTPLTEAERAWLRENQPVVDAPGALEREVEEFRAEHAGDPDRIITFHVALN